MKDKSLVFIGDSISGSQFQSMLCLLSKIEVPILTYHDETFRSMTLYFSNHNLTVAMIWSPFLVKSENFKAEDPMAEIKLHIDTIEEKWASQYNKYDYIVLSDGQWFLRSLVLLEDNVIVGCNYCKNSNLKELGIDYAYRKALHMAYEFMSSSDHKPLILFRAWSPNHFEHGDWSNGGVCNRTSPYGEGQCRVKPADHLMRRVEIEEFQKAAAMSSRGRARLKQLDTYHLSLLRPDAHLGPYGTFHPFGSMDNKAEVQNDCIHWCVPGLVDTWNELIMKIVVDEGDVSYSYGDSVAFY